MDVWQNTNSQDWPQTRKPGNGINKTNPRLSQSRDDVSRRIHGRQSKQYQDDVIYSREQTAKRLILDEVKQREAVKRISAKYDSGGLGLPHSGPKMENVAHREYDVANIHKTDTADTSVRDTKLRNSMQTQENMSGKSEKDTNARNSFQDRENVNDQANVEIIQIKPNKDRHKSSRSNRNSYTQSKKRPESTSSGYKSGGLSDGASDISGRTMSSSSSGVSSSYENSQNTVFVTSENPELTEHEIAQVELFYQSHKTDVFVCKCMANIYFGHVTQKLVKENDWKLYATGIPVLLLDTGFHHRTRRLYFFLAERGTGFVLWKDVLDNLSNYTSPHANFHTLQVSTDHTKLAGISFDENSAASDFLEIYKKFTSNPNDDLMKLSSQRSSSNKKDSNKKKLKYKGPKKTEISQPCCFVHMTTIQRPDMAPLCEPEDLSLGNILTNGNVKDDTAQVDMDTNAPDKPKRLMTSESETVTVTESETSVESETLVESEVFTESETIVDTETLTESDTVAESDVLLESETCSESETVVNCVSLTKSSESNV